MNEPISLGFGHEEKGIGIFNVSGWSSPNAPINNLLLHLSRKSQSEGSKKLYLWHLKKFCQFSKKSPSNLVSLKRDRAERLAQGYADCLRTSSAKYANT